MVEDIQSNQCPGPTEPLIELVTPPTMYYLSAKKKKGYQGLGCVADNLI